MAIAVQSGRRRVTHRPPMLRRRSGESDAPLPLVAVMLFTMVAMGLVVTSHLMDFSLPRSLVPTFHPAAPSRPADGATPVAPLSVSTSKLEAAAVQPESSAEEGSATATQPALDVGARARVANTDNMGVVFYAAPRDNARQPAGLLEGTVVTVLERSGDEWARVQSDSKKSGWVRAQYLVSAE